MAEVVHTLPSFALLTADSIDREPDHGLDQSDPEAGMVHSRRIAQSGAAGVVVAPLVETWRASWRDATEAQVQNLLDTYEQNLAKQFYLVTRRDQDPRNAAVQATAPVVTFREAPRVSWHGRRRAAVSVVVQRVYPQVG